MAQKFPSVWNCPKYSKHPQTPEGLFQRNRVYFKYVPPQHKEPSLKGTGSEHGGEPRPQGSQQEDSETGALKRLEQGLED